MLVGYARTSTVEQIAGFEDQIETLQTQGCERLFEKQVSSVAQRDELDQALKFVREGDTLVVTKLDRLARSTQHLLSIIEELEGKGVALRILDFGGADLNTHSPTGKMMLTMFAAMAEYERSLMLERQRIGIAKAKAEGAYKGRTPVPETKVKKIHALLEQGKNHPRLRKNVHLDVPPSIVF